MKLNEYMDIAALNRSIDKGYISRRGHPSLPIYIYNYTASAQFDQHWPHEVCACRGLITDEDNNIISRPQYKFFNLGQPSTIMLSRAAYGLLPQVEENVMIDGDYLANMVDVFRRPITFTRKMDGQMGILWNFEDKWGVATRGSFMSEGAIFATDKFQKFVKYGAAQDFIPKGTTLIFEIIAKHLRIVIPYEWEGLCLLTAVDNVTGAELPYDKMHELWTNLNSYSKTLDAEGNHVQGKPWCRVVEKFDIDMKTAENDKSMEEEGYVASIVRHDLPPIKVKIKLAEYKRIHRILSYVTPQMIWAEMARPMDEWLFVENKTDRKTGETVHSLQLPSEFRKWVLGWQRSIMGKFHLLLKGAIQAEKDLQQREVGNAHIHGHTNFFANDKLRKDWLRSPEGGKNSSEVTDAALMLRSNRIVEAYELLWSAVRPHGREDAGDYHFYEEGRGE